MTWWEWVLLLGYVIPALLGLTLVIVAYYAPGGRLRWLVDDDKGELPPHLTVLYGEVDIEGEEDESPLGGPAGEVRGEARGERSSEHETTGLT